MKDFVFFEQKKATPFGIAFKNSYNCLLLVHSSSELSARLELSNLLGSNLDLFLRGGVDTLASGLLLHGECAETNELNFVTLGERTLDGCYCGIECLL